MSQMVFDVETRGLKMSDGFVCMSYTFDHRHTPRTCHSVEDAIDVVCEAVASGQTLIGHNIVTFDLPRLLWAERIDGRYDRLEEALLRADIRDTLYESHRLYPSQQKHGMEYWAHSLQGTYQCEDKVKVLDFATASVELIAERCVGDVTAEACLADFLCEQGALEIEGYAFEKKFFRLVIQMLANGVPYYPAVLEQVKERMLAESKDSMEYCRQHLPNVNINSTPQVEKYLQNKYGKGLPPKMSWKKNKDTGRMEKRFSPSMDKRLREQIVQMYPEMHYVFTAKEHKTALDYVVKTDKPKKRLIEQYAAKSSVPDVENTFYPSLSYVGARTGRMQYSDPPVNQIPPIVREAIGDDTKLLVGLDIVALETAWMGYFLEEVCAEPQIMNEVKQGLSAKKLTLEAFRPCLQWVKLHGTKTIEDVAKEINYSYMYGITLNTLMRNLNMPRANEQEITNSEMMLNRAIEKRFPAMDMLTNYVLQDMDGNVVRGYYGTPVHTEPRNALNALVQNSGADYARRVMYVWWQMLCEEFGQQDVYPIIYNMDEIQIMIDSEWCAPAEEWCATAEERCKQLVKGLPARAKKEGIHWITDVDVQFGTRWSECH